MVVGVDVIVGLDLVSLVIAALHSKVISLLELMKSSVEVLTALDMVLFPHDRLV